MTPILRPGLRPGQRDEPRAHGAALKPRAELAEIDVQLPLARAMAARAFEAFGFPASEHAVRLACWHGVRSLEEERKAQEIMMNAMAGVAPLTPGADELVARALQLFAVRHEINAVCDEVAAALRLVMARQAEQAV